MPFKSEAQRKWMWANHPEMAKHWQSVTPKGKKLPEHVKQAAFLDELSLIMKKAEDSEVPHDGSIGAKESSLMPAGPLGNDSPSKESAEESSPVGDWVSQHPVLTSLGVGGLGAGAIVGKRLLTKALPARGNVQRQLRRVAQKGGIGFNAPTNAMRLQDVSLLEKLKHNVRTMGAAKPIYTDPQGYVLSKAKTRPGTVKGVSVGLDPDAAASGLPGEVIYGGAKGRDMTRMDKAMREISERGKVFESGKQVGLGDLFASGGSVRSFVKKHGIKPPNSALGVVDKKRYLSELQGALKKQFRRGGDVYQPGFVLKPHDIPASGGRFASHKEDWGKMYADYEKRLKPQIEALRKDYVKNQKKYGDQSWENVLANKFRDDKAYGGVGLAQAISRPGKAKVERMMNLKKSLGTPAEYRVHTIGGEVPNELAVHRYGSVREVMSRIPGLRKLVTGGSLGSKEEAADWVRKNVLPKVSQKYRRGNFGMDVARVKRPDGSYTYRLVELNPGSTEGVSGFLTDSPVAPANMYKWLHGKEAPVETGLKAVAGGGALAGATGLGLSAMRNKSAS